MSQPTKDPVVQQSQVAAAIQAWLLSQLAEQLEVEPDDINIRAPFDSYDLDSAKAMVLVSKAEKLLGFQLSPVLLWHYPTIEALAQRLAEEAAVMESELFEQVDSQTLAQALVEIEHLSQDEVQTLLSAEKKFIAE